MISRKANQGFTLIEVLIVVFIISITTTLIFLKLSPSQGQPQRFEDNMQQLVNLLELAQQEAVLRPSELGLIVSQQHYAFSELHYDRLEQQWRWQLLRDDSLLHSYPLPENTKVKLIVMGQTIALTKKLTLQPQIILSSSGDLTPFVVQFDNQVVNQHYRIQGQANGAITMSH